MESKFEVYDELSKEKKEMIEKACKIKKQLIPLFGTRDYYYMQVGKIETSISNAIREKNELIHKIMKLNKNIASLEAQYEKEIHFEDVLDSEEENK